MKTHLLEPFPRFAQSEAAGGVVLLAFTAVALAWANSPWAHAAERLAPQLNYPALLESSSRVRSGP